MSDPIGALRYEREKAECRAVMAEQMQNVLRDELTAERAKVARLREAIERAPHGRECPVIMTESLCICWKAEALKEVQRDA